MKQKEPKINKQVVIASSTVFDFFRKEISETRETINNLVSDNRKMPITTNRKVKAKLEW